MDRKCPLSVLTYPTVSQLRELVVDSVTAATVETILSNCIHLYSLHVIYRRSPSGQNGVAYIEDSLDLLHHSSVKKLILENTADFSSEHLLKIAHLEELILRRVAGTFTVESMIEAITRCPNLCTLVLYHPPPDQITRSDIRSVLDAAPKLHTFAYVDRDSFPSMEALQEMTSTSYPHIKDPVFISDAYGRR